MNKEKVLKWVEEDLKGLRMYFSRKNNYYSFLSYKSNEININLNLVEGQEVREKVFEKIKNAPDNWEIDETISDGELEILLSKTIHYKENKLQSSIDWWFFSPEQQAELDKIITTKHKHIAEPIPINLENISFWEKCKNTFFGGRTTGAGFIFLSLWILLIIAGVLLLLWLVRKIITYFN